MKLAAVACTAIALATCVATSTAQVQLRVESNVLVRYSDGYRTTARLSYPDPAIQKTRVPLLVLVPGLGSSHVTFGHEADSFASMGYCVVTYDVRGQASTKQLNGWGGSRLWAVDEWIDLAEIIEWAAARLPGTVDARRIGVFGDSQGGIHAWAAAAYSGKYLPGNPRRSTPFPTIGAVAPRIMAPQTTAVLVPGDLAFQERFGSWLADPTEAILRFDPEFRVQAIDYMDRDDPAGLAKWLRSIPGRDFAGELQTSSVPVFAQLSWLDEFFSPELAIEALDSLPKATPRRLLISTGFHGTPLNTYQFIMRQRQTLAWFDYYLAKSGTGPDGGPPVMTSAMPGDPRQYRLLQSLWRLRDDADFPAADTKTIRYDLDALGRLRTTRDDVFVGKRGIVQSVLSPSFGWREFARDRLDPKQVASSLPVDRLEFRSVPLTRDLELAGSGSVLLRVTPSARDFQVGVRLFAEIGSGERQLLCSGGRTFRGASTATADYSIALGATTATVPTNARLVLEISNHVLQRPGDLDQYRLQPMFESFRVDFDFPASRVAKLELTVRQRPRVDLGTGIFDLSVDNPKPVEFFLQTSPAQSARPYFVLLSLSPPTIARVPSQRDFWFTRDSFTDFAFQFITTPVFDGFLGVTDAQGLAKPQLRLDRLPSVPKALRGLEMRAAPIVLDGPKVEAGATLTLRFQ